MSFKLGNKSLEKLATVQEPLQRVVKRAIELTPVDFTVLQGIRSVSEQKRLVAQGRSKTMKSKHLEGKAVDLVPYVDGKLDHDNWDNFYPVAEAMKKAAEELGIKIRWGGSWEYINHKPGTPKEWVAEYVKMRKSQGKSAFIDAPHFELE